MEAYRLRWVETRPPIGVSPAMLILNSIFSAVVMVVAPRIGVAVSLIFLLYWTVQIIRTSSRPYQCQTGYLARPKPLRELGPEFLVILALQLPWIVWLFADRSAGRVIYGTLIVLIPVISLLAYRGFGSSR